MPYKHHQDRSHKFNKAKYKVTNWEDCTESLRRRDDITIWFSYDAINDWHPTKIAGKPGRPKKYSDISCLACLIGVLCWKVRNFPRHHYSPLSA